MYDVILFDFDGTIADTMEQNYLAWEYALNGCGFTLNKEEYFEEEGKTPRAIAESFTKEDMLIKEIISKKEFYFLQNYQLKIFDGVKTLLEKLYRYKKLVLVTGGGEKRIRHILKESRLSKYFDIIITADDVTYGKPHPEPYLKALEKLQITSNRCLVVENAPYGITAAKKAQIFCVALTTTLSKEKLQDADLIFKNFRELLDSPVIK